MEEHKHKKLSIDFLEEKYIQLKMACAKKNTSINEFVTKAIIHFLQNTKMRLIQSRSQWPEKKWLKTVF